MNELIIPTDTVSKMKQCRKTILDINELETMGLSLSLDKVIERQNAKNLLFHLIDTL